MQRLKTRPQFQAAMAGGIVSRTAHFALHRLVLSAAETRRNNNDEIRLPDAQPSADNPPAQPRHQPLFNVHGVWLGAMVPKRWARRAVTRNAIKRQIYTVGDTFEARLATAAHVVRLRAAFDRKQFPSATSEPLKAAVQAELVQLFAYAARRTGSAAVTHRGAAQDALPLAAQSPGAGLTEGLSQ